MFIDSRDLRLLAAQGLTMAEIARELKQPYFRVRKSCQMYGVDVAWDVPGRPPKQPKAKKPPKMPKAPKPPRVDPNAVRNAKMVTMYRQGLTLQKIGDTFGLTRERVRQLLRKQGVGAVDGGVQKASKSRADARKARREAQVLAKYGLSNAAYRELIKAKATRPYQYQRNAARCRGIKWDLTLAQWWDLWTTSGKWEHRGRGKGKYCMSRIKDSGGYEIGNVHIQLCTENSLEAVKKWRGKEKANRGVFHLYPGLPTPYLAKVGRKSLGLYASEDEAVAARVTYANANGLELGRDGRMQKAA